MNYCKRCLYPSNHPLYITFDERGLCSGCIVHEEKDAIAWVKRTSKLEAILDSYRDRSGYNYDCVIPVSGGKDSYFIVHTVKKVYGLNPLLVSFNQQYNTKIGIRNLANLLSVFDCDHLGYTLDPELCKKFVRYTVRRIGSIYWHCLAGSLTFPVQVAVKLKIPLIVWGVHGWSDQVGMFSHLDEVEMTKKVRKEHALMTYDAEDMIDSAAGITRRDVQPFVYPYDEEIERVGVKGVYLSNYIRWDSKKQHEEMIRLYGYETAEQERTFNTYEDVECFHSAGLHDYIKFLKWGYGKVTDHASREIRLRRLIREDGIELVKRYEGIKPRDMEIFLDWAKITEDELYECINRFRDRRIWHKNEYHEWQLLDSVANHRNDFGVEELRLLKVEDCNFMLTPSREPGAAEDQYYLMGRGYIDKFNFSAVDDTRWGGNEILR